MASLLTIAGHTAVVELSDAPSAGEVFIAEVLVWRFYFRASRRESGEAVLGQLALNCDFALIPTQRDAWLAQIEFLRSQP